MMFILAGILSLLDDNLPNMFVLFLGRKRRYWTDWLCSENFRHCAPFWFDAHIQRWVIMDSVPLGIHYAHLSPEEFDEWLVLVKRAGARILRTNKRNSPHFFSRLGLWCVPFTAHVIGSRSSAWRPEGLWRDLLKEGAVPAFDNQRQDSFDDKNESAH